MKKKRLLLLSLPLIAVFVVVYLTVKPIIKTEVAKAYAVCERQMLSIESYQPWVYQHTELNIGFNLPLFGRSLHEKTGLIFFFDGCGEVSCSVNRDSSGWHEGNVWRLGTCLP